MIEHYLTYIDQYLQEKPYMGVLFAFLISFTESLPLFGTIIPGSITMSIIGILIGRGIICLEITFFWASLGALVGDAVSFSVGKYYNENLRLMWPFKKYSRWITLGESFFRKHGGKSIFIGRFVGPIRSSVPLIAGLLKMSWTRFFTAAIPSAILWAVAYLLPGVLIGAVSLRLPRYIITKFILIGLSIVVLLWLLFWAIQQFFTFLVSIINKGINQLWKWLYRHYWSHFLLRAIINSKNLNDHHQLTMTCLAIINLVCFIRLSVLTATMGSFTNFNKSLFFLLQNTRSSRLDKFFALITIPGDIKVILITSLFLIIALSIKKHWRVVIHLFSAFGLSSAAIYIAKWLIYFPRPQAFLVSDHSSSFPSGHACLSLTIFGFISFLVAQQLPKKWHWISYTLSTILITLISYSRLYLGAHWLQDVFGSFFLGFAVLFVVIVSYRRHSPEPFGNLRWLILLGIALILPWIIIGKVEVHTILSRYSPIWNIHYKISSEDWWRQPTRYVPIYRWNRFGHPVQPFNIQWIASLDYIQKTLECHGWKLIHTNHTKTEIIQSAFRRFTSYKPERHFPIFPWLYHDKSPALFVIMYLPHTTTIIELRLWDSGIYFKENAESLWIGSINYHTASKKLISLRRSYGISFVNGGGINQLIKELRNYQWKKVYIYSSMKFKKIQLLKWNGEILVIRLKSSFNQN